jgi:hypothetical protein
MHGRTVLAFASVVLLVCPTVRLSAQSDPRLQSAVQLFQSGHIDSARAVVRRILSQTPPASEVYPEALYVAGIIAPDPPTVMRHLQRVVVEYELSPWADDALLRLTQLYVAQGDPAAAAQAAERLRRDHPDSPLRAQAAFQGARAYFELRNETRGCALIRDVDAEAGDDVELRNQASFYVARCGSAAPPPPTDTARRGATAYAVQVLAVKSAVTVDEMLTRLQVMGYPARVVRDSAGLFKVRVGRYATREEAQRAQAQLRQRLGGQPFVVEDP